MQIDISEIPFELRQIQNSGHTLLWLEGSKTSVVQNISLQRNRLVVTFTGPIEAPSNRIFLVEKCVTTKVGLQFWNQGKAAVLYMWQAVPKVTSSAFDTQENLGSHSNSN